MLEDHSLLAHETDSWHALVADQTDHVLFFKLHQGVAELSLLDLFLITDKALSSLGDQVFVQIHVLDSGLGNLVSEVFLDPLDIVADDLYASV